MRPNTRDLLAYLDRVEPALSRLTHFELLDVTPGASSSDIQRAYHAVAARMHPDGHRAQLTAAQYERLNIVYGRITEAYRVLRDDSERARYTREQVDQGGIPAVEIPEDPTAPMKLLPPKAQRMYRRAIAAKRTGDTTSALLNLKMALRLAPGSALLTGALADLERPK